VAQRRAVNPRQFDAAWKGLPLNDRRFIGALAGLIEAVDPAGPMYAVPPARIQRVLDDADRATLFGVMVECLGMLLDAPALARIKRTHGVHGHGEFLGRIADRRQQGRSAGGYGNGAA
jgi:hypothetical protein